MEKEISNGAFLGIVLIALASIIGLGFGIFTIAKGTANDGVTGVQESLGTATNAVFTDFDQKIITGIQIEKALQDFSGKPYTILIATQAVKDNTTGVGTIDTNAAGLANYTLSKPPVAAAYADSSMGTSMAVAKSSDTTGVKSCNLTFIQYNNILADGITADVAQVGFDQNCWRAVKGFHVTNGKVDESKVTGSISKSGMVEYISSNSKFQSYLIKDLSGTVMGMAFEQISSGA